MELNEAQEINRTTSEDMVTIKNFLREIRQKIVHKGVRKHLKNMSWMVVAKITSMVISFLATAYIARNLGPHNYGQLSYALSFVGIFSFFAPLGIDQILHRDLIKHSDRKNEYLGSALVLRIISSTISVIICVVSAFIMSPKDVSLLLIFITSLSFLLGSFQLLGHEFQAKLQSKYPSILNISVVLLLNILKIVVIFLDRGVIYLACIVILEPLLYSLGYIYLKSKIYQDLKSIRFNKTIAFSILRDSYPLIFASAFFAIYSRIDQVMLKNMINSEAVGLYDSAVRISELSYFLPQILLLSLYPPIVNAKKISEEFYRKRLKKLLIFLTAASVSISLFTTIFAKYLLLIIFSSSFLGALPALYICLWSTVGASLNALSQQILLTENLTKNMTLVTFLGMVVNVILNLILIPIYGISGAAFATLISYTIPFLSLFLFKNTRTIMLSIIQS